MCELVIATGENKLKSELLALGVPYKPEHLPLGDALIRRVGGDPVVIIERKTVDDLMASITDGRYKEQSARLQEVKAQVWWIIEGKRNRYRGSAPDNERLHSALASLGLLRGFVPTRTDNTGDTALLLQKLLAKSVEVPDGSPDTEEAAAADYGHAHKRFKGDCIDAGNIQAIMLAQVPGVSFTRAQAILAEISLGELLSGTPPPAGIRYAAAPGKAPRAIPKPVLAAVKDYLAPEQP